MRESPHMKHITTYSFRLMAVLLPAAWVTMTLSAQTHLPAGTGTSGARLTVVSLDQMLDTTHILAAESTLGDTVKVGGGIIITDNTPRITADGRVMFFNSNRYDNRPWAQLKPDGRRYDTDIYYMIRDTTAKGREVWGRPLNVGPSLNRGEDDAVEPVSPNGGSIYFTSLRKGWVVQGGPFFRADFDGRSWKNITGLGGGLTEFFKRSTPFKIYGATMGVYGDVFYFSTTAHSPSGDQEIWVSRLRDGVWTYPENLGPNVNSGAGSYAPFIAADGRTLYFTSGRSGGIGSGDVYVTMLRDTQWQEPVNLGPTINSLGDDAFFSIPASGDRVYLSGARGGIVSVPLAPELRPSSIVLLSGTVTDKDDGRPIDATVTIEDLKAGTTMERSLGGGINNRFASILLPGRDYGISVSAAGYGFYSMRYTIPSDASYKELTKNIVLEKLQQGRSFSLNNIFFGYNSDNIDVESDMELDRLVTFMKEHPSIRIMVSGHTDNIGSEKFNEELSRRRADAVRNYLMRHGALEMSRIETKAYGATMPSAPNTTDEGRQKNRCVQFTILTM